jgi:hypothetical protein
MFDKLLLSTNIAMQLTNIDMPIKNALNLLANISQRALTLKDNAIRHINKIQLAKGYYNMAKVKLFYKDKEFTNESGHKITVYKPNKDIKLYIKAININTGEIEERQILEFTKHENLIMYKIEDKQSNKRFKTFHVSDDHSLIVYDKDNDEIVIKSPIEVINDSDRYYLIKQNDKAIIPDELQNKIDNSNILKTLYKQQCELIGCNTINIVYDPDKTIAYDFTVDGLFTFANDDGIFLQDTFAIFVPFTKEGIQDSLRLLNPYHPANPRRLKYEFNKDYKYAACLLWSDPIKPEYAKKYWWWNETTITFQGKKYQTTKGRQAIFNLIPEEVYDKIDINWFLSKHKPEDVAQQMLENGIDVNIVKKWLHGIQLLCNDVMTQLNIDLDILDMRLSEKLQPLIEKLDENASLDEIQKQLDLINAKLKELIKTETEELAIMDFCGVAKFGQLAQLLAVKGLILSPDGKIVLIKSNFSKGLKPTEYFKAGHGARMGIVSRAQKTAISGYLQRQMIYATAPVELDEHLDDCGTGKTIDILVTEDLAKKIINRYVIVEGKTILVTPQNAKDLVNKRVALRSPIYCISKKVCRKCYGEDWKLLGTTKIGFIAGEALGERFSQEMMKAFHTGGVVKFKFLNPIEEAEVSLGIPKTKYEQFFIYDDKNKLLKAKDEITLILDREFYNLNAYLRNPDETGLELEALVCDVSNNKETIPFAFDSSLLLKYPDSYKITKENYILTYNKDSVIFQVLPATSDVETKTKRVLTILNGKGQFKDVSHLITKIYREIKDFGDIILVHIEVLLSQLLRCPDDLSKPFRLCNDLNKQPKLVGLKKVPYLESWKRGLEFERVGDAIDNALINPDLAENESLLEKLL